MILVQTGTRTAHKTRPGAETVATPRRRPICQYAAPAAAEDRRAARGGGETRGPALPPVINLSGLMSVWSQTAFRAPPQLRPQSKLVAV